MVTIINTPEVRLLKLEGLDIYNLLIKVCESLPGLDQALRMELASVTEFIETWWYIKCSRVASHQIVRHRLTSVVQRSQRRTIQDSVVLLPRSVTQICKIRSHSLHNLLVNAFNLYNMLIHENLAIEKARYILPQCSITELFLKCNLRELAYIVNVRMCRRAQAETRYIAIKMHQEIVKHFPDLRNIVAPHCVRFGFCKYVPEKRDLEKLRKCRVEGYREAFMEHGTEEELKDTETIISELP